MANYTENFNLKKLSQDDFYNVEDQNENMDKIDAELKTLSDVLDNVQTPYGITSGTNTYITSIPGIAIIIEGMSVKIKFTNANTGASTLNINDLGAVSIRKGNSTALSSGNIKAGQIVHLVYTGTVFQLLGEGGEYGTATSAEVMSGYTIGTEDGVVSGTLLLSGDSAVANVLSGKTFYSTNPKAKLTGTMPNRGEVTNTITTQSGQYTIPQGYHSGSGKVTASFANLIASNVRNGVNVGGIIGNLVEGAGILSVQRGSGTMAGTTLNASIPISNVDMSKSVVMPIYTKTTSGATGSYIFMLTGRLTTGTNLRLERLYGVSSTPVTYYWQVVEFSNLKSLQKGSYTLLSAAEGSVAISSINLNKSILLFNYTPYGLNADAVHVGGTIASATNIIFSRTDTTGSPIIDWQVIEFN